MSYLYRLLLLLVRSGSSTPANALTDQNSATLTDENGATLTPDA